MPLDGSYLGANFTAVACPICGGMFSKCGLPNHMRRHQCMVREGNKDPKNRRSAAWWHGWKEGYKLGLRDGGKQAAKRSTAHREVERSSAIPRPSD